MSTIQTWEEIIFQPPFDPTTHSSNPILQTVIKYEWVNCQCSWVGERNCHKLREVEHGQGHCVQTEYTDAIFKRGQVQTGCKYCPKKRWTDWYLKHNFVIGFNILITYNHNKIIILSLTVFDWLLIVKLNKMWW